jgi:mRNA-degrading endonuclease RelE of RelBE toxin-antitoxin system
MSHHKFHAVMVGLVLFAGTFASPILAGNSASPSQNVNTTVANKDKDQNTVSPSVCEPESVEWKLDKKKAKFGKLTKVEQAKFDQFKGAIKEGMSPRDAAAKIGDADFKVLNKKINQYQIRLSHKNRVTFLVDHDSHTVTILQVGGHT